MRKLNHRLDYLFITTFRYSKDWANCRSKLITLVFLLFIGAPAQADPNWYQIELIVFEQQGVNTEKFEQIETAIRWPRRVAALLPVAEPLDKMLTQPVTNTRLLADDLVLKEIYAKLRRKSAYKPLLHIAWLQSVEKNRYSEAIQVKKQAGIDDFILNGFVRLQRGHYLHLQLDLEYTPMISTALDASASEATGAIIYHLQEKRRIKLNEVHYIDHPRFGVIATVKPLKIQDSEQ